MSAEDDGVDPAHDGGGASQRSTGRVIHRRPWSVRPGSMAVEGRWEVQSFTAKEYNRVNCFALALSSAIISRDRLPL